LRTEVENYYLLLHVKIGLFGRENPFLIRIVQR
jgi:hypothetical protein